MPILFRVNNALVELSDISDGDDVKRLSDDNTFAIACITDLTRRGLIMVDLPITRITRVINDTEEKLIHNGQEEPFSDPEEHPADPSEFPNNSNIENIDPDEQLVLQEQCKSPELFEDHETAYILDLYHKFLGDIGPMRQFKNKKTMWQQISVEFQNKFKKVRSATQIENRYKTVIRRKKDAVDNNAKSGRSRQEIPFEEELSKIASIDDSIAPELIRSAKKVKIFKSTPIVDSDFDIDTAAEEALVNTKVQNKKIQGRKFKRQKSYSVCQTLELIHEKKEAARQARHEEKLQLIRELMSKP